MNSRMRGGTLESNLTEEITNGNPTSTDLVTFMFCHQIKMKMLHFQTTSLHVHKGIDAYLTGFMANFDSLMEVLQGLHKSRIEHKTISLNATMIAKDDCDKNNKDTINELEILVDSMHRMRSRVLADTTVKGKTDGLVTIIDNIITSAQQTIYLLTFK